MQFQKNFSSGKFAIIDVRFELLSAIEIQVSGTFFFPVKLKRWITYSFNKKVG